MIIRFIAAPSSTTRLTDLFIYLCYRSDALWMATSSRATWRSCRSSPGGRSTRNWVLQQSSTTASMSRMWCRAQNNRKEQSASTCLVLLAGVATMCHLGMDWMCDADLHFSNVCFFFWSPPVCFPAISSSVSWPSDTSTGSLITS